MVTDNTVKTLGTAATKKASNLLKKNLKLAGEKVVTKAVKKSKKDAQFHIANFFTARQAGMMAGIHTAKGRDYLMSAKPTELAKLGAGIGAVKGGLDYLGGEDKSLGALVGNVGVNATAGGALGYSGGLIRNYVRTGRGNSQSATSPTIITPPPASSQSSATNLLALPSTGTIVKTESYSNPQNIPNPRYSNDHVFDARNRVGVKTLAGRVRTSGKFISDRDGSYRLQKSPSRGGATLLESNRNTNSTANFGASNYNIANFGVGDMLKRLTGGNKKPKSLTNLVPSNTKLQQNPQKSRVQQDFDKKGNEKVKNNRSRITPSKKSNPLTSKSVGSFPEYAL